MSLSLWKWCVYLFDTYFHYIRRDFLNLELKGATAAQARAALKKYKDVMRAAERIFEGEFEDLMDDDVQGVDEGRRPSGSAVQQVRIMVNRNPRHGFMS